MRLLINTCLVASLTLVACSSSNSTTDPIDFGADFTVTGLDLLPVSDLPHGTLIKLEIIPTLVTADINGGQSGPDIPFYAVGTLPNDQKILLITAEWSVDRPNAGTISTQGVFTPNGSVGGNVIVTAKFDGLEDTSTLTLRLHGTNVGSEPPGPIKTAFENATQDDPSLALVYPYDQTVFPRGLSAPLIQWKGGGANDTYWVRITSPGISFSSYGPAPLPSSLTLSEETWSQITNSTVGDVTVTIQRYNGSTAFKGKTQTWKIANADLRGTIYYTQLTGDSEDTGGTDVMRIQPGGTAKTFLEKSSEKTCIACHSLSANGARIVAATDTTDPVGNTKYWAVFDARTGKSLFQSGQASWFEAISPDGEYVLTRHYDNAGANLTQHNGKLLLSKYNNTSTLATLDPPTSDNPGHPAWSPDGKKVAFSMRDLNEPIDFMHSTLWITDVDLQNPGFSNTKKIVDANEAFGVVTYPSFSPDSKWVSFMRSTSGRTSVGTNGQVWISSIDGTQQVELKNIRGIPPVADALDNNFGPSFHPIQQGGYMWLAFFSRRLHGNQDFKGKRQIWLAAIDAKPNGTADPSHPAFYINGQNAVTTNERPQFSVNPCVGAGESCTVGFDCCEGLFCRPDSNGKPVCGNAPPMCRKQGDRCDTAGDCCANQGLDCIGHICDTSIQ